MALFPTLERLAKCVDRHIDHQIAGGLVAIDQRFAAIPAGLHQLEEPRGNEPVTILFARRQSGAVAVCGMVVRSQLQPALPGRYPRRLPRRLSFLEAKILPILAGQRRTARAKDIAR